jgi:hypothetical protein
MSKHLSCADTAKLIRQALKEAFAGVKFTVRSSTYSGGASINIGWTDGPNAAQVEAVAKRFSGAYFDGQQDYKGCTFAMLDGQVVRFGADFVFCNRTHSADQIGKACASVARRFGMAFVPTAFDFKTGRLHEIYPGASSWGTSVGQLVREVLAKRSDRLSVGHSKTAARVIYLGNDGHSKVAALAEEAVA